jgi:hypothetical protein
MKRIIIALSLFYLLPGITYTYGQQIYGTKVLLPGNCCVYGYVIYTNHHKTMVSPPTYRCGSVVPMKPQVVFQNTCRLPVNCCIGMSLESNDSFIVYGIGGGGAPAYVIFSFTIDYFGYQSQSFNFPGYVDCYENLTACRGY